MICYEPSWHAWFRMIERHITEDDIEDTLGRGKFAPMDNDLHRWRCDWRGRQMTVVVDVRRRVIVTVMRWQPKGQRDE